MDCVGVRMDGTKIVLTFSQKVHQPRANKLAKSAKKNIDQIVSTPYQKRLRVSKAKRLKIGNIVRQ